MRDHSDSLLKLTGHRIILAGEPRAQMLRPLSDVPVLYRALPEQYKQYADVHLGRLLLGVNWVRRDRTPRQEAYYATSDTPYTYGSGLGIRTYLPDPSWPEHLPYLWAEAEHISGCKFELCFLNRYDSAHEHLGWHADDSPEIDPARPIAVVSLGAERELWFRKNGSAERHGLLLGHGSILIMEPGMQQTHQHRIPKHPQPCGVRISLTFRGLKA